MKQKRKIGITELVLRDGHQSLLATRMRTEDMLPICNRLDKSGFWSLEVWGGATFDACIRFLREDPWVRLRKLRRALPNTQLQMLLRGQNLLGYRHYADDVVAGFVERAAANGMDVFRVFDALNDFRNMRAAIDAVKKVEKHAQGTISYTTSPLHSIDVLAKLADDFTNAGCDSIAIKDMAGIMTPTAAAALVTAIKARTALPVHVHAHATSGLAAASLLAAVNAGASIVDTVISSFAEGASHPATESIATALEDANFTHGVDANLLDDIALYFRRVRGKYWQFESPFTGVDSRVLKHHVPGGMISNLTNQLREQNALDKIDEVLEEIPRVRHDLGYPPLVTPSSQIVGAQAVLNVVLGERYKMVSNEVKNYLLGQYGRIPGEVNAELYAKAVGDDDTAITCRPADLLENGELERLRSDIGQVAKSDEDVLTYAMFPELAKTFLQERAANALVPEALLPHPETKKEPEPANAPSEFNLTVHGETYHIRVTGAGHKGSRERPFYMTLDGVPTEIMLETLEEIHATANESVTPVTRAGGRPRPSAPGHVATAMPGTVLELLVKLGDAVKVGTPLLIMEAMKMENEIQAAVSGQVTAILVQKGDAVTPDEILMEIGE